jgi:hypothetical protein
MIRSVKGFKVDWGDKRRQRVWAEREAAPKYVYWFEVSADRQRIVLFLYTSAVDVVIGDSDPDRDAERFEKDARQAVEEFLRQETK